MNNLVFSYSRADAIRDGVLIDVSAMANEAGIKYPVAVTSAVWNQHIRCPENIGHQDDEGRLWDMLMMFRLEARRSEKQATMNFQTLFLHERKGPLKLINLKAVCGPGDDMNPVVTIMLPEED